MINQTKGGKFGCNRIMFISGDTVKPGSHYFTVPTKVRETSIESMLKKIYDHDFFEPELQYCINNKISLNPNKPGLFESSLFDPTPFKFKEELI